MSVALDVANWRVGIEAKGKDAKGNAIDIAAEGQLENIGSAHRTITGTGARARAKASSRSRETQRSWCCIRNEHEAGLGRKSEHLAACRAGAGAPFVFRARNDGERQVTLQESSRESKWVNLTRTCSSTMPRAMGRSRTGPSKSAGPSTSNEPGGPTRRSRWARSSPSEAYRPGPRADGLWHLITRVSDKQQLFVVPAAKPGAQAKKEPTPRWPDGQVRLGPRPGEKGFWGRASAVGMVENKAGDIRMNGDALLFDLADADRVAPFRPWSRAVYLFRQRNLLVDDPLSRCLAPGGPRQFQGAYGFQFVEQRELKRILVLLGGENRNWHPIYMDGRKLNAEELGASPPTTARPAAGGRKTRWSSRRRGSTSDSGSETAACRAPRLSV